jgi:hypothetical protein
MILSVVQYLNQYLKAAATTAKQFEIAEVVRDGEKLQPGVYAKNGEFLPVSFDEFESVLYHRQISAAQRTALGESDVACENLVEEKTEMRIVVCAPRLIFNRDIQQTPEQVTLNIANLIQAENIPALANSLNAQLVSVEVSTRITDTDTVISEEFTGINFNRSATHFVVAVNYTVTIQGSTECFEQYSCDSEPVNVDEVLEEQFSGGQSFCERVAACPVITEMQSAIDELGGGGLTCETLAACSVIQNILSDIEDLEDTSLTNVLPSSQIFVGSSVNVATAVSMSGDATLNNVGVLTLASVITAGTDGAADSTLQITYDAKGRLTAVTELSIAIVQSQVSGLVSDLAAKQPLDATLTALAGLSTAQGDLIYATGADAFAMLNKSTDATRYLSNTGTSNNPAWAQVDLTNGVSGDLDVSHLDSGSGASAATYWRGDAKWENPNATANGAALSGTANQISLSSSGAGVILGGTDITLSLPQNIHTTASPQFRGVGLGAAFSGTTSAIQITQGIITSSVPAVNTTATWNSAGTAFTGWSQAITDTASNANSVLMGFSVGGSAVYSVRKDGASLTGAGTAALPTHSFIGDTDTGVFRQAANVLSVSTGGTERIRIGSGGNAYFGGAVDATAKIHVAAGAAAANTAPIKLTAGTNNTTGETGAVEYNGTNLFFVRSGTTRETVWCGNAGAAAPATNTIGVIVDYFGTSATRVLTTPNSWASVVIGGTTYKIPLYA